ncbi:hypothetical protein IEU95_12935 [Hoyosella rhizosphaerae]|uniref:Uncharacterized protein n=1 Tax=Hoyosella rhizosphaerae TaxID=1755582 RepID=A0A916XCK9_9ACTN|nr:hypothetical protein [Hoyosella rhizosphaerae]MBN4927742.1 hypothetical protein [Hoyosella rhizosphaerae]GGC61927.1 hypothetical protein GCM10011410_13010 [Hoyosella rhizosphaerae]
MVVELALETRVALAAAGGIFLWALVLGVWKYAQIVRSPQHQAHVYVDIAHRAALMYAFAALLLAPFAELSAWPSWVNTVAVLVVVVFFVGAIASYVVHGALQDTTNQFAKPVHGLHGFMFALIACEIGGFAVLFVGFLVSQF